MKIGVFDSGLGGLLILRALARNLPEYDYIYLGDTQRVPYGNRSRETVGAFLEEAVDFLFKKDCALVIVACNTASAEALRQIQRNYLPLHYPKRRVLGVIIPTAEAALRGGGMKKVGVLATQGTVRSEAYVREIAKIDRRMKVVQQAAPLLVPFIESGELSLVGPVLRAYLAPLMRKKAEAIILGCTHYPVLKAKIKAISGVPVIAQDEIIPGKLRDYLKRHPEIDARLSKKRTRKLFVTDVTPVLKTLSRRWFGPGYALSKVTLQ